MASVNIRIIFIKDCLVYTEKTTQYLLKSPALVKFGVINLKASICQYLTFKSKQYVEDFTLKHLLLSEVRARKRYEKVIYKHSETAETIEYVKN